MSVVVGLSARSIQSFVFSSNRLVDVVGASALIETLFDHQNLLGDFGDLDASIITAAGGSAVLTVPDIETAKRGVTRFSRRRIAHAPALPVDVALVEYNLGELGRGLTETLQRLARTDNRSPLDAASELEPGLATCRATGTAAAEVDERGNPISRQAAAARHLGTLRTRPVEFPNLAPRRYRQPTQLDELGRTSGERSIIGVVHLDGNRIGSKIDAWARQSVGKPDDDVRFQARAWSDGLEAAVSAAWDAVESAVVDSVDIDETTDRAQCRGDFPELDFTLTTDKAGEPSSHKTVALPLRKILQGGDDLTFVCDGRIALSLAAVAARSFRSTIDHLGEIDASVGVALVHSHAPFLRAYDLASQATSQAKAARDDTGGGEYIDWHLGLLEPGGSLPDVRDRAGLVSARPYRLDGDGPRSWDYFTNTLLGDGRDGLRGNRWRSVRHKARQLPDLARGGPDAVQGQLDVWRIVDPDLRLPAPYQNGFHDNRSPLAEAVELLDRHQPLGLEPTEPEVAIR